MALPLQSLRDSHSDVGALISEEWLNRFSEAHFEHGADFYQGSYETSFFEAKIAITYKVTNAIKFDLSPIETSKFSDLWFKHLEARGANYFGRKADWKSVLAQMTPPNLKITSEGVSFVLTIYDETGEPFSVDFHWDIEARCAVVMVDSVTGGKSIRLEPLKVKFTRSQDLLASDIRKALADAAGKKQGNPGSSQPATPHAHGTFGDPTDPIWCTKVENLLLFIINQILSQQLASFIRLWDLPRALELHDSLNVTMNFIGIEDKYLVTGAQISSVIQENNQFQAETTAILGEFSRRYNKELRNTPDNEFKHWSKNTSNSLKWLQSKRTQIQDIEKWSQLEPSPKAAAVYPPNIALVTNDKLFDVLAKTFLNVNNSETYEKKLDFVVRGAAGWWFRIFGATGRVVPGGFEVQANIDIGAFAEACIPNPDPKHWGSWMCKRLCVVFRTRPGDPFALDTTLHFWSKGIYGTFNLTTQRFEFDFCEDYPWPISELIDWFKSIFEEIFTETLRTAIGLIQLSLYKYPPEFPGTPLMWTPQMNTPAGNEDEFLIISGDPTFA